MGCDACAAAAYFGAFGEAIAAESGGNVTCAEIWATTSPGYIVAADLDGAGGHPWTYIAPGIGYPTGWNDPSIIWGTTQSLGLGGVFSGCSPAESRSWGSMKALFQ